MRYETWVRKFRPIRNHLTENTAIEGFVFLHHGDNLAFIRRQPPNTVWSFLVCDDGRKSTWIITDGFHVVNLMGYLVCETPYDAKGSYTVYY